MGSGKDHGRGGGLDNEVCIHTLECNVLVHKKTPPFSRIKLKYAEVELLDKAVPLMHHMKSYLLLDQRFFLS